MAVEFFVQRWKAQVDIRVLFWRDLLAVGTVANLLFGFTALVLITQGVPAHWVLVVHFGLLPYNAFLLRSVWKSPQKTPVLMLFSTVWFGLMLCV